MNDIVEIISLERGEEKGRDWGTKERKDGENIRKERRIYGGK
jgi:hypothetical protein